MDELSKDTYASFKQELDRAMHQAAEAFVQIGYLLRKAKETDVLASSGYDNVNDFAKGEYGLSPDQVSRYIAINERFSVGGYAPELREDMKGYGIGKLQIMLTLPDEVVEVIPQEVTKQEVSEIQKEVKQEQAITDIEVMLEEKQKQPAYLDRVMEPIERFYIEYFYEQKTKWKEIYDAVNAALPMEYDREVASRLCPSGIGVLRARVPGEGMMMLTFRGKQNSISLLNVRSGEKTEYGWDELAHPFVEMYMEYVGDKEEAWFNVYQEHFTEQVAEPEQSEEKVQEQAEEPERSEEAGQKKEEVAPVQQQKKSTGAKEKDTVPAEEKKAETKAKEEKEYKKSRHLEAAKGSLTDVKRYMREERWADAVTSTQALQHHLSILLEGSEENERV